MPKGDTHKKKHQKDNNKRIKFTSNELRTPKEEEGEIIGLVINTLGVCNFRVKNFDNDEEVTATITGTFRKGPRKEPIYIGNYVLLQTGISKNQYFIVHKYQETDIDKLHSYGILKGKSKKSVVVENTDVDEILANTEDKVEVTLDDVWDI